MKKNFMAIASLLIAAMLLVVSCAPEAKVEGKVEDGLVNASLMATAAGKALTVSYPENEALSYTITLDAEWDKNSEYKMDEIVGEKTINLSSLPSSIDLGWISQGLWTVTVEGKRNNETVVKGSTTKYITDGDKSVIVFLGTNTTSTKSTPIDFDITVNELAIDNANYSLKATIVRADKGTNPPSDPTLTLDPADDPVLNTRNYTGRTNLTPGYYKVTVQLIKTTPAAAEGGQATNEVIGGITKGVFVKGESRIEIKGSVSASDFAKGSLAVIEPEVTITGISAAKDKTETSDGSTINLTETDGVYKGEKILTASDNAENYTITYAVEASYTPTNQSGVTITGPVYTWTVDGEPQTENSASITATYTAPGHKNVTCLVTYLCSVNINGTSYQFTIGNEAVASVLVKGPAVAVEPTGEATTQTSAN